MKISILIPSQLKRKEWIVEAFRSAVLQTLPPHEILVANTDGHNFNHLLKIATGDAFLLLCDDDLLDSTYLEKCAEKMRQENVDIVCSAMTMFGNYNSVAIHPRPWTFQQFRAENPIWITSLFKREVFEKIGGYDPDAGFEDWDFWWRAFDAGFKCAAVGEALFHYRQHGDNDSKNPKYLNAREKLLKKHAYENS